MTSSTSLPMVSPLRQRMIDDMRARKLGRHSERSHIHSCKRFAAKKAGIYTGGKPRISRDRVAALTSAGNGPAAVARSLGVSRISVYRILRERRRRTGESTYCSVLKRLGCRGRPPTHDPCRQLCVSGHVAFEHAEFPGDSYCPRFLHPFLASL